MAPSDADMNQQIPNTSISKISDFKYCAAPIPGKQSKSITQTESPLLYLSKMNASFASYTTLLDFAGWAPKAIIMKVQVGM
jgi:hypothetical protein